eukprot:1157457-Pelagomonas_calceolata.AAC.8
MGVQLHTTVLPYSGDSSNTSLSHLEKCCQSPSGCMNSGSGIACLTRYSSTTSGRYSIPRLVHEVAFGALQAYEKRDMAFGCFVHVTLGSVTPLLDIIGLSWLLLSYPCCQAQLLTLLFYPSRPTSCPATGLANQLANGEQQVAIALRRLPGERRKTIDNEGRRMTNELRSGTSRSIEEAALAASSDGPMGSSVMETMRPAMMLVAGMIRNQSPAHVQTIELQ